MTRPRPPVKPLLSVEQAAILLGESRSVIYRSIERGDLPLPVFRINGRLRIPRRAVQRLIEGENPLLNAQDDAGGGVPDGKGGRDVVYEPARPVPPAAAADASPATELLRSPR